MTVRFPLNNDSTFFRILHAVIKGCGSKYTIEPLGSQESEVRLKPQNRKFCVVLNGVMWYSVMQRIFSKPLLSCSVKVSSLYCLTSSPLHLLGPLDENVPIIT